jgi:hypothetical protein
MVGEASGTLEQNFSSLTAGRISWGMAWGFVSHGAFLQATPNPLSPRPRHGDVELSAPGGPDEQLEEAAKLKNFQMQRAVVGPRIRKREDFSNWTALHILPKAEANPSRSLFLSE